MRPGRVIAGRFELEAEAGLGGVGTVYRVWDREAQARVALKVVRGVSDVERARFGREARVLSQIRHPAMVRYVAHGTAEGGDPYIAMEWLEGEDLRARLARQGLTMEETVVLARRVVDALAMIHGAGLVHRDVKPGNLFLVGGRVDQVKLIDFGLARAGVEPLSLTSTGLVLGTPGYMAPEQARGQREIDGRADLFALGCVLYKCLTGRAPFEGSHIVEVMTRVLLEDPPPIAELRPGVPAALSVLVTSLLAKDPDRRPRSAAAVAGALAEVELAEEEDEAWPAPVSRVAVGLTAGERRVMAVLLMGLGAEPTVTERRASEGSSGTPMLGAIVHEHGGRMDRLADGTLVITLASGGAATDQAARAARCALALRSVSPAAPMALAVGRREVTGRLPVGEAIERAAAMLARSAEEGAAALAARRPPPSWVAIDEATSALLAPRFDVRADDEGRLRLYGAHEVGLGVRTVLGKTTSFVGRDWELSAIGELFRECVEGLTAAAVLVTAPAGMGKSRLCHELTAVFKKQRPDVEIWVARGDSARAGSALGLLAQALRGACGIREGEPIEVRRRRLVDRVARHAPAAQVERIAGFLGEMVGAPFPDEESAPLRAARADARIMGEQMCRAWEDFLAAECSAHPVVLVLEDLHWGDGPTGRFVDAALGALAQRPWMVLALGRPEVHEIFPALWKDRNLQEIRLKPLMRRAGERLVQEVLGEAARPGVAARLAALADGNVFYLEELIRAVAQGTIGVEGGALPETVLAMVQARLGALDPDARRVLRAASVFGEVFWSGGVEALLGGASSWSPSPWVDALVVQEILVRRRESRFEGEVELAFRHALLREGAYAMLTEADRLLGHHLAGEWLEVHGERDPVVLAQHFERGGDLERAGRAYLRAAGQALRGMDLDAARAQGERALACGVGDEARVESQGLLAEVHAWRFDWARALASAAEVVGLAAPGTTPWIRAMAMKLSAGLTLGRPSEIVEALVAMTGEGPAPEAADATAEALSVGVFTLCIGGQFAAAEGLHAKVTALAPRELVARGWASFARSSLASFHRGDAWDALRHAEEAHALFEEAGDRRHAAFARAFVAMNRWLLGAYEEAERDLRGLSGEAGEASTVAVIRSYHLAWVLVDRGAHDEARALARRRVAAAELRLHPTDATREAEGRWLLGEIARRTGDLEIAERELEAAVDPLAIVPTQWTGALASRALARLARGRAAEAAADARAAVEALEARGADGIRGLLVRLAHAESLLAVGDRPGGLRALADARARLLDQAARIGDVQLRSSFLTRVFENARILDRCRELLGEA